MLRLCLWIRSVNSLLIPAGLHAVPAGISRATARSVSGIFFLCFSPWRLTVSKRNFTATLDAPRMHPPKPPFTGSGRSSGMTHSAPCFLPLTENVQKSCLRINIPLLPATALLPIFSEIPVTRIRSMNQMTNQKRGTTRST